MTSLMETKQEPRSWAEMVQTIDRDRKSLPWDPTKTEPVKRAGMWEVRHVCTVLHERLLNNDFMSFVTEKESGARV
jgi:hypothetical protein